jgi:hypothetical protein
LIQIIGPPGIYIHADKWIEEKFPKFLGDIPKRLTTVGGWRIAAALALTQAIVADGLISVERSPEEDKGNGSPPFREFVPSQLIRNTISRCLLHG